MLTSTVIKPAAAPEGKRGDEVDWREQAACRGFDFKQVKDDPWNPVARADQDQSVGMTACWERCTVRQTCLDWAIATEPRNGVHGILGGLTEKNRKSLYRKLAKEKHLSS